MRVTAILLAAFLFPIQACAQGTKADYERANGLAQLVRGKVFHGSVDPNWIGKDGRFWYRNDLARGKREFILVNPVTRARTPAFDHARLAEALSKLLSEKIEAEKLPIERIAFPEERSEMLALVKDKTYAVNLQTYEVKPDGATIPGRDPGRQREGFGPLRDGFWVKSPDGRWQAVIRTNNVILRAVDGGSETALTTDGSADDRYEGPIRWSPDSTKLVVFKTVPAQEHKVYTVESSPRDQLQPKLHTIDYLKPGDRIAHPRPHILQIAEGLRRLSTLGGEGVSNSQLPIADVLFPNPWEITEVRWEPDSKHFTFLYNQRGHQVMRLISVDAESGEAKALIDEQAKTFIDWTNKVFLHRITGKDEAIWMSERDGWNHLYLYDLDTGQVKNQITRGSWVVRGVDRVDDEKRQIWFRAGGIKPEQDPYYQHYCRVNFDGSGLTVLTEGDGTHRAVYSPNNKFLIDICSRVDMPPVITLRSTEDGSKVLDLERADASALMASGWKFPERFVAKGRDGTTDIYGVIIRPSNFDPKKKYPVIENIYAGPQGAFVPKQFFPGHPMHALAELGFIIVDIDGMGTNWRSKAFHDVCCKNLGDAGFPDRILWIKAAAAKYPYMDLTRVGIYGGSAGGQNALGGLLQHGDFYKAGVADCGCHDNRMDKIWWNEQWMGYPVGPEYEAQSNVTLAPKLTGKLLLMVGELDTNVDPASTMQVVNALIKANKDFDVLVVPGAGHGTSGSTYGQRRLRDFFVRNLLHVQPPDVNGSSVASKELPSITPDRWAASLNSLHNEINNVYGYRDGAPRINLGPCGRFARDFRERWNARFREKVNIVFVMTGDGKSCYHVMDRLPDGTLYDGGNGVITDQVIKKLFPGCRLDEMKEFDYKLLDKWSYGLGRKYQNCPNYQNKTTTAIIDKYLSKL